MKYQNLIQYRLGLLLICATILGGTSQPNLVSSIILSFISILLFSTVLIFSERNQSAIQMSYFPFIIGGMWLLLHILYLIPVPPTIWEQMAYRDLISMMYNLMDEKPVWMPLSITPEKSYVTMLGFFAPFSVSVILFCGVQKKEIDNALISLVFITLISSVLGLLQYFYGLKSLYLFDFTNFGKPVGFFSNTSHFAVFMTINCALITYNIHRKLGKEVYRSNALGLYFSIFLLTLSIFSIVLTRSIVGAIGLGVVFLLSSLVYRANRSINKLDWFKFFFVLICFSTWIVLSDNLGPEAWSKLTQEGGLRYEVLTKYLTELKKNLFIGTGPGSFKTLFYLLEDKQTVTNVFANEAHNDFLQVQIELGLLGSLLVISFVLVVLKKLISLLMQNNTNYIINTFALIGVVVVFIASVGEYPLRTPAIGTLFTFLTILAFQDRDRNMRLDV